MNNNIAEFLVYIFKNSDNDKYAWIVKEHIPYDIDKNTVKIDGDLGTNQFLNKYGDFSEDNFYICSGDKKFLENRVISRLEFDMMNKKHVQKNEYNKYIFVNCNN
jgi:hypothetical protein